MSNDVYDIIKGAAPVIAHYGAWPSFHDADYVTVHVDMVGPTVLINFRLYDWDEAAQKAERPSLSPLWREVEELHLSGIEELGNNAIGEMQLNLEDDGMTAFIQSTGNGTTAQFRAASVEVTHFDPHEEWDYETRHPAFD